jgi:DNA-binding transcriptional LysR family regulator
MHSRDLRYFLAVAEHLHITRAAASLFITQPALSKQIAALERQLQVTLFERRHAGVTLTTAGETLRPFARQIVELAEQAGRQVRDSARTANRLTIGFWLSPADAVITRAVRTFAERQPLVGLRLRRADWSEPAAGVPTGDADVGFVQSRHGQRIIGLKSFLLATEDSILAVREGHPLSAQQSVTFDDLVGETMFSTRSSGQAGWGEMPGEGPGQIKREFVSTMDETMAAIVSGLGTCLLTPSISAAHLHPGVVTVPMPSAPQFDYWLVWREAAERDRALADLVAVLAESFRAWALVNVKN